MSQSPQPGLNPEQVSRLQSQLDAANAQVARVQAELSGAGTTSAPAVPAVITVNGQAIHTTGDHGDTEIAEALRAAHPGIGSAPLVMINGAPLVAGQTISLQDLLSPQQLGRVQGAIGQMFQTHPEYAQHLQDVFGAVGGTASSGGYGAPPSVGGPGWPASGSTYPTPESVARLVDPPRHVPLPYRLATFNLSGTELFVLFMAVTAPIALWGLVPMSIPAGLLVLSGLIIAYRTHLYRGRIGMLRWGKVARVTDVELAGRGSYYGGVTYQNMRMRQAVGWRARTEFYSGPGYRNKITYELDGARGELVLHGRDYAEGVVLASSRNPSRAMCVSAFPYDVEPTSDGQWPGHLSAWLWGGIISTLAIELTVFYVTAVAVWRLWLS